MRAQRRDIFTWNRRALIEPCIDQRLRNLAAFQRGEDRGDFDLAGHRIGLDDPGNNRTNARIAHQRGQRLRVDLRLAEPLRGNVERVAHRHESRQRGTQFRGVFVVQVRQ